MNKALKIGEGVALAAFGLPALALFGIGFLFWFLAGVVVSDYHWYRNGGEG